MSRAAAPGAAATPPGAALTFSVILLDIDHFKAVNDTFGHATGDVVLSGVADVLRSFLRRRDVAGRWGGEEFLLVVPGAALERAARVAERLRVRIESSWAASRQPLSNQVLPGQLLPTQNRPGEVAAPSVTASFGVACCRPGDSLEALLTRADHAMYRAKRAGRNRVELEAAEPDISNADISNADISNIDAGGPPASSLPGPQPGGPVDTLSAETSGAEQPARELTGTDG